ncbi:hypothetical protein AA313_de0206025 [Arthrobotrys entomopaga]|nr:hypothetical protein AA313_de0206025 [Arthrobotrys entomopaga]
MDANLARIPTPPFSDDGKDGDNRNSDDDQNVTEAFKDMDDLKPLRIGEQNGPAEKSDTKYKATTGKKRGRQAKPESERNNEPKTNKKAKVNKESKASEAGEKKPSKGRKATTLWTDEEDAYLRELYTTTDKIVVNDIHAKFEEKFETGRTAPMLKSRWYKLKAEALETILKRAIETYENEKYATILQLYNKDGGDGVAKLTRKYVAMKVKEWGAGTKAGAAEVGSEGEDS